MLARLCAALLLFHSMQIIGALLPHSDLQDRPHRIVMQMAVGCSGSSFIYHELGSLIKKHGYDIWSPAKEFLVSHKAPRKKPYCTESDGTKHYWKGEPHHIANLKAAWNVLNGSIICKESIGRRPTIFWFDGHNVERMADVVPFLGGLAPKHAHVHSIMRDPLEHLICQVKDCFVGENVGYPVVGNGIRSDLCFQRRQGEPDDYKVHLNPDNLKKHLEPQWPHEQGRLNVELSKHGSVFGDFPKVTYEELTAFEFTNETETFQASLNSWTKLISGMGITPDHGILEEHLKQMMDSRAPYTVSKEVYNFEEVAEYCNINGKLWYTDSVERLARLDHETDEDEP